MLKKILLIIAFLFLTISNQVLADTNFPGDNEAQATIIPTEFLHISVLSSQGKDIPAQAAADKNERSDGPSESTGTVSPFYSYIIPGLAAILIIGGFASYWFVLRKKLV